MDIAGADVPAYVSIPGGVEWVRGRAAPADDGQTIALDPSTLEHYLLWDEENAAQRSRRPRRPDILFGLAGVRSPHDACAVARRYGLLSRGPGADDFREPYANWQTIAEQLRLVLDLVSAIQAEDAERVDALLAPLPLPAIDGGPLDVGSLVVEQLVKCGLRRNREGIVAAVRIYQDNVRGRPGHWFFAPEHEDLAAFAFHRLGQVLGQRCRLLTCARCGRVFVQNHGNQTRFCEKRCAEAEKKRRSRRVVSGSSS